MRPRFGGTVHISGPLSVVYEEMRMKIMCYTRTDALLRELELRLHEMVSKALRERDMSEDGLAEYKNYDRYDELINHMALAHVCHIEESTNGCCADKIVALQDEIERLTTWAG